MVKPMTSIRLDTHLADEAAKILGVKTRTEAVHVALKDAKQMPGLVVLGVRAYLTASCTSVERPSASMVCLSHACRRPPAGRRDTANTIVEITRPMAPTTMRMTPTVENRKPCPG